MTHTNHRQGTVESLKGDWVVQMRRAKGINDQNASPKLKKFLELSLKYDPVGAGCSKIGNTLTLGWQKFMDDVGNIEDSHNAHIVFDSADKVAKFLKDLVQADFGCRSLLAGFMMILTICAARQGRNVILSSIHWASGAKPGYYRMPKYWR